MKREQEGTRHSGVSTPCGPITTLAGSKIMDNVRIASEEDVAVIPGCCRCAEVNKRWDRIAGQAYCPNCQESLIQGEGDPLVLKTEKKRCAVCDRQGTVSYLTFPLQAPSPVEIELCPEHLRALIGRCLEPSCFHQLRRRLHGLGIGVEDVFLLHRAFYDAQGHAFMPAMDVD